MAVRDYKFWSALAKFGALSLCKQRERYANNDERRRRVPTGTNFGGAARSEHSYQLRNKEESRRISKSLIYCDERATQGNFQVNFIDVIVSRRYVVIIFTSK